MAKLRRLSFKTKPQHTRWDDLLAMWLEAETIEALDTGWLFDHFYPIFPDASEGPCFEGWTALAYLAGRTQRLRLGLLVTGNPYRHPAVLANMAATVDVASGGRLELGLGAGWNQAECDAYGIELLPIGQRMDQLEEACEIIDALLTRETTNFHGKHFRITDARCEPKPLQRPRPPLVIGGLGEKRTLRIAARFADEWNFPMGPPFLTAELFAQKVEVLHAHCADLGRDPAEISLSMQHTCGPDPEENAAQVAEFVDAGANHIVLYFDDNSDTSRLGANVDAVVKRIGLEP
jgi:F420-dependent oxidoreductase-like protein